MPEVVNTVSSFTIAELTGDEPKVVTLVGRALPYRPYSLSTSQRMDVTWYPGNPEATATLLGAKEDPTSIGGAWKDKFIATLIPERDVGGVLSVGEEGLTTDQVAPILLNNVAAENVRQAASFIDEIVRGGQLVDVTWDETTRHGYLRTFRKDWLNARDLEWEMNFEWISRGEPSVPSVFTVETSLSDAAGQLTQANSDLQEEADPPPFPADPDFTADLTEDLATIDGTVTEFNNTVVSIARAATAPAEAVRRAIALATNLAAQTDDLVNLLFSRPAGFFDISTDFSSLGPQERLVVEDYNRRVQGRADDLKRAAINRRSRLVKQLENDLLTSVFARAGTDLRDLAEEYYGSPFEWRRLLVFNELTTSELSASQLVLIPRRAEEDC